MPDTNCCMALSEMVRLRRRSVLICLIGFLFFPMMILTYWQAALLEPYKHVQQGVKSIYRTDLKTLDRLLSGADVTDIPSKFPCRWCGRKKLTGNGLECVGPDCVPDDEISLADIAASRRTVKDRTGSVDCPALFSGDSEAMKNAKRYMKSEEPVTFSPSWYIDNTRNCSAFRRTRGYFSRPLSKKEEDFPIAYSILMYDSVEQVERLLRAIYMPQNFYCIHVDAKSPPQVQEAVHAIVGCFNNVVAASRFVPVYWGHMSVIEAEMTCIEDLLRLSSKWKYFINLSGQMFPTHSNAELVDILTLYGGANDVEASRIRVTLLMNCIDIMRYPISETCVPWVMVSLNETKNTSGYIQFKMRYAFEWYLSPWLSRMIMTPQLKGYPPFNVTVLKGSNQVALTRDFVLYFMYHPWSQTLIDWFSNVFIPDEYIWPTISNTAHLHAPGSFREDPERKPFTVRGTIWRWYAFQENWSWDYWECKGKWVRDICIFGVGDLPWLAERPELFVNKFHADFESLGYDCMEELIFNRTLYPKALDMTYYEEMPFVRNRSLVVRVEETRAHIKKLMTDIGRELL